MRISLLALEGLFDTGLTVTLDAFTIANRISARMMGGTPFFEVSVVGVRKRVRSGQGLPIPVKAVTPDLNPDWVILPALSASMPPQLLLRQRRGVLHLRDVLRRRRPGPAVVRHAHCRGHRCRPGDGSHPHVPGRTLPERRGVRRRIHGADGAAVACADARPREGGRQPIMSAPPLF